ncbi:MAG: hypothetical protein JRC86_04560, partial [Deltaproteobacteria bacterium]|nr:hypothetical protein [Deltaproteobacteria bacterium]
MKIEFLTVGPGDVFENTCEDLKEYPKLRAYLISFYRMVQSLPGQNNIYNIDLIYHPPSKALGDRASLFHFGFDFFLTEETQDDMAFIMLSIDPEI